MTIVSGHQSTLVSLNDSKYARRFLDQIKSIEQIFFGLDETLQILNTIQRKWIYLEPIFNRGSLTRELARFRRVDQKFKQIMAEIGQNPKVQPFALIEGIRDTLSDLLGSLDLCQKALNDYLEEKRNKFSRFYFIGDDDLLEILGQSQNPEII